MSYEFTTDEIIRDAGEGAISEAIDEAVGRKVDDETRDAVNAVKRLVLGMVPVLGPDVVTYTVNISGNHATAKMIGNIAVEVDGVEYAEPE